MVSRLSCHAPGIYTTLPSPVSTQMSCLTSRSSLSWSLHCLLRTVNQNFTFFLFLCLCGVSSFLSCASPSPESAQMSFPTSRSSLPWSLHCLLRTVNQNFTFFLFLCLCGVSSFLSCPRDCLYSSQSGISSYVLSPVVLKQSWAR